MLSCLMPAVRNVDQLLARKGALDARAAQSPELGVRLRELRAWQAARLAHTYRDLSADPCYTRAIDFFLTHLYGPHDFHPRDRQFARAWRYMKRMLPAAARASLEQALQLETLSAELDHAMLAELPAGPLTGSRYARAYRQVGRRDARRRQIALVVAIGEELDRIVKHAWIGAALRAAHAPAHAAGFGVLQDFLERGFAAFRHMTDAEPLLRRIRDRETRLMDQLFSGRSEELLAFDPAAGTSDD
jgi:hypothetical protein